MVIFIVDEIIVKLIYLYIFGGSVYLYNFFEK